jgi:large repetitive protein
MATPMSVDNLPVNFSFESSEPESTFECKIDDSTFEVCTSPNEYTSLSDGPHTFDVRATDAAGNTDPSPDTFEWTVDTQGPATTINSGPSHTVSAGTARFEFTS